MVLECGIAVHSIIMGFTLGALTDTEIPEIRILFIIYVIHQIFEACGLAIVISQTNLSLKAKILFATVFSVTLPLGIAFGMWTVDDSKTSVIAKGCANCLASGILVYTALVEMLAEDFKNVKCGQHFTKLSMFLSLAAGFTVMAVLAIWA
jgi:zinc transporter 1/2/3